MLVKFHAGGIMLLSVDVKSRTADRVRGKALRDFDLVERDFQQILFNLLDRLLPDDELIVVAQSRAWKEEPDLMAVDANGKLYIFELKRWEAKPENLLQVLRYGQIYGSCKYEELNRLFQRVMKTSMSLQEAHSRKFEKEIPKTQFNCEQVFVVMTNGIDTKTREAVRYWRSRKLEVQPWIYRVYELGSTDTMHVEIAPFRVEDNPYEDLAEGFYILNTNYNNDPKDHEDMIDNKKAAAYSDPWKYKIEQLGKGDIVFLYRSGTGIVAFGTVSGDLVKSPHRKDGGPEDQYSKKLSRFEEVTPPLSAAEIKEITENNYVFMGTMFGLDAESGKKLLEEAARRTKSLASLVDS